MKLIRLIKLLLFISAMNWLSYLSAEDVVDLRPIDFRKAHALTTISEVTKLLPTPAGIGGNGSEFGSALAVDGQLALVGAKNMAGNGLVYAYQYDGVSWNEIGFLSASDGRPGDQFGHALAISGNRAIIANDDYISLMGTGAVYVFDFDGVSWSETQKLIGNDSVGEDKFGQSVSLDGDRALIGAIFNDQNGVDSGAAYVFDYDGSQWLQTQKVMASDGDVTDYFGHSVSISNNQLMVGTIRHTNDFMSSSGATYVFEHDGSQWIETQKLIPADASTDDRFGYAISLDNNRALISAINGDTATLTDSGTVYVFEYDGNDWTEAFELSDNQGISYTSFGYNITLLGDEALIANRSDNQNGIDSGSAVVFDFDGVEWIQTQKVTASDGGSNGRFGNSVGISGNKLLVGSNNSPGGAVYSYVLNKGHWDEEQKINAPIGAAYSGFGGRVSITGNRAIIAAQLEEAAYIYQFNGLDWSLMQKLTSESNAAGNNFAGSVSIDGNRVLISATGDDEDCEFSNTINGDDNKCENSGAVFVYEYQSSSWVMVQKLKGIGAFEDNRFGDSVSIFGDQILIGQWRDDWVFVFQYNGTEWVQTQKLSDVEPGIGRFGVAVTHDANKALIGASLGLSGNISTGAAYVFDFDGTSWSLFQKLTPSNTTNTTEYGSALSLLGHRALIGARRDSEYGTYAGAAFIYDFDGSDWLETQKLTASDAQPDDWFGFSVSQETDRLIIGAHRDDDNGIESGSAYVFDFDGNSWAQTEKIVADDGQNDDHFGVTVAFYSAGMMIGATGIDDYGTESGAMYVISSDRPDLIFVDHFD